MRIRKATQDCMLRAQFLWAALWQRLEKMEIHRDTPAAFVLVKRSSSWVDSQRDALGEAFQWLESAGVRHILFAPLSNTKTIYIGEIGYTHCHHRLRYVYIKYERGVTDCPLHLASILVNLSQQMALHESPSSIAAHAGYERQLEFLSLIPEADAIYKAVKEAATMRTPDPA